MAIDEDEDLQRAFRMSLSQLPDIDPGEGNYKPIDSSATTLWAENSPEAKRSKSADDTSGVPASSSFQTSEPTRDLVESSNERRKRIQREERALAAERRIAALSSAALHAPANPISVPTSKQDHVSVESSKGPSTSRSVNNVSAPDKSLASIFGRKLSDQEAQELFKMVFGENPPEDSMAQWTHQGFRFSREPETSIGLVQREGGPCGVLAPIQALVIKCLLFQPGLNYFQEKAPLNDRFHPSPSDAPLSSSNANNFIANNLVFSEVQQNRALVHAMSEALWQAGKDHNAAVVVTVQTFPLNACGDGESVSSEDEMIEKCLENVSLMTASDLESRLNLHTCKNFSSLTSYVESSLPIFRSRLGALLFLFSAILSRTLNSVQSDRDDPEQMLVTRPFGHASQEIVNLLLCGHAVANVFDGNMDLGGGMCLKGIDSVVEVGFLSLLESLNFCKVGSNLKNPKWPIWVVGSETHYTVLFALSTKIQEEDEEEAREAHVRAMFDELDSSGGGGFIAPEALTKLLERFRIRLMDRQIQGLTEQGVVLWNDLEQVLLEVDRDKGGFKGLRSSEGRTFELMHFNGIAKSVDGMQNVRPRLTQLQVFVPPPYDPRELQGDDIMMFDLPGALTEGSGDSEVADVSVKDVAGVGDHKRQVSSSAPLVQCIRTRWQRASCSWVGEPPSIV